MPIKGSETKWIDMVNNIEVLQYKFQLNTSVKGNYMKFVYNHQACESEIKKIK